MSKFSTTIPVAVEQVIESLPSGSFVTKINIGSDKKSLVIEWEQDNWRTPYTVPVEVSVEALAQKEPLPQFIKLQKVINQSFEQATPKRKKSAQ